MVRVRVGVRVRVRVGIRVRVRVGVRVRVRVGARVWVRVGIRARVRVGKARRQAVTIPGFSPKGKSQEVNGNYLWFFPRRGKAGK